MDLSTELYNQIREDAAPVLLHVDTHNSEDDWPITPFSTRQLHAVMAPMPNPIELHTLTGLVDFIKICSQLSSPIPPDNLCVHIENTDSVVLCGSLNLRTMQRPVYAKVSPFFVRHAFGEMVSAEKFVIWLQSCFVDEFDRASVLSYAGNIVQGTEAGVSDDGVTQAVTVRTGITSKAVTALPNPVVLSPYRTFAEIEQPDSRFIFRAHEGLKFSLTEADGGAWRNVAIHRIEEWICKQLDEIGLSINVIA